MSVMRVTAYKQLIPLEHAAITPDGYVVNELGDVVYNAICPMLNDPKGTRTRGLGEGQIYTFSSTLTFAIYTHEQHAMFIEALCEVAKYEPRTEFHKQYLPKAYTLGALDQKSGICHELITMGRMGTLGPEACMKLANEMHILQNRVKAFDVNMGFESGFYDQFMNWYDVFCTAGDTGMVTVY